MSDSIFSRLFVANKKIAEARQHLKYEDLSPFVDYEKVKIENLDKLNQVELFALLDKHPMPYSTLGMIGAWTVGYFGAFSYVAFKRGPTFMMRATANKPKNLATMILTGTRITCQLFGGYVLGLAPMVYFSGFIAQLDRIGQIRTALGNSIIINDDHLQEFVLVQTLQYFELSDKLIQEAKQELRDRREKMKKEASSLEAILYQLEIAKPETFKDKKDSDEDL